MYTFTKRLRDPLPSKIRCWNCRPYMFVSRSNSCPRVPSNSTSISLCPCVATAIGEASTSLTMAGSPQVRIDGREGGRDGRERRECVFPDARRLQPIARDEEHDALVAVDASVRAGAAQRGDRRPSSGFREHAFRLGEELLPLEDLRIARRIREAARAPHDLDRFEPGGRIADRKGLGDRLGFPHGPPPAVRPLEAAHAPGASVRLRAHKARPCAVDLPGLPEV